MSILIGGREYTEHTTIDFEFVHNGDLPEVVCLSAYEIVSGRRHSYNWEQLRRMKEAPFPTGPDALVSAYPWPSEGDCFKSLGWSPPANVLDHFSGFRWLTNGLMGRGTEVNGLFDALDYFHEPHESRTEKKLMQERVLRPCANYCHLLGR